MKQATEDPAVEVLPPDPPTEALTVRQQGGAIARAMTVDELHRQLEFIREVMRKEMKEGQDYGKIPGTGEKPTLLQPGAQKLLMTFNLTEKVKKETLREYPGFHREYEFTITVCAANGKEWDGVGTCSTLESKYRYRKAERRCPACGKEAIIQGKAEYGGGWVCFKKKGGCGTKFHETHPDIISQPGGTVENEDPADCWNTVRKMAFKRGLVAAAINATNTSELWTQDIEEMKENWDRQKEREQAKNAPGRAGSKPAPQSPPATPQSSSQGTTRAAAVGNSKPADPAAVPKPWPQTRKTWLWCMDKLQIEPGQSGHDIALDYFRKVSQLLPNEQLDLLPLRYVPLSKSQLTALKDRLQAFAEGEAPIRAFDPNDEHLAPPPARKPEAPPTSKPVEVPRDPPPAKPAPPTRPPGASQDPEWWRDMIVPIPPKGLSRAVYMEDPQTIGELFDLRHEQTADGAAARTRLWGFVNHFQPKSWTKRNGEEMPPSDADIAFRQALDSFADWFAKNHPDEKL